jgi:hypothetical protein
VRYFDAVNNLTIIANILIVTTLGVENNSVPNDLEIFLVLKEKEKNSYSWKSAICTSRGKFTRSLIIPSKTSFVSVAWQILYKNLENIAQLQSDTFTVVPVTTCRVLQQQGECQMADSCSIGECHTAESCSSRVSVRWQTPAAVGLASECRLLQQ